MSPPMAAALLIASFALGSAAHADSTSSAASSAASASIGSLSDSVQSSSRSSPGPRVAQGEYRVVAAQPLPDARVRLSLQGAQDRFDLLLPAALAARVGLGVGAGVQVAHERFGLSFLRPGEAAPFFLALDGAFAHELDNRPVRL